MSMFLQLPCSVCGQLRRPLPDVKPKQQKMPGGSIQIEGTPEYCACTWPKDVPSPFDENWMWICHIRNELGGWDLVDYPALHHNGPKSEPAEHNMYCGFYLYRIEELEESLE